MNWLEIDYPDDLTAVDVLGIDCGGGGGCSPSCLAFLFIPFDYGRTSI